MVIQTLPVDKLVPADYNPRKDLKPGDPEYEKLKRSITEFGYVEPVIWNKTTGHVVGGQDDSATEPAADRADTVRPVRVNAGDGPAVAVADPGSAVA